MIYYSADNIWIIGRQQEKEDKTVVGYHFIINIEKSRHVKEKSRIPISVTYESGINKWSGMFDLAKDMEYIVKAEGAKAGYYNLIKPETGEILKEKFKGADIVDDGAFWNYVFKNTSLKSAIKEKFTLSGGSLMKREDVEEDVYGQ